MHAQDSLKRIAAVEELFRVMHMEETMQNAVETMTTVMANSNPALAEYKDIVHDYIAKYMSWARLKKEFVSLYAAEFTESEIRDIATFYRSSTGQKAVAKIPVLMQKGASVGQRDDERAHQPRPPPADAAARALAHPVRVEPAAGAQGRHHAEEERDSTVASAAAPSTRRSIDGIARTGRSAGTSAVNRGSASAASPTPSRPPPSATSRLSVTSCRTSRDEPAPSAARNASSRRRMSARASIRLAMFGDEEHAQRRRRQREHERARAERHVVVQRRQERLDLLVLVGVRALERREMGSSCADAAAIVTPGFSLPTTCR